MRPPRLWPAILFLALCACGDPLPRISLITEMDIFGSRVEVVGDEARSSPRPGESATFALSVVYPERVISDAQFSMAVLECTFPDLYTSVPVCQEFISAFTSQDASANDVKDALPMLDANFACTEDAVIPIGPLTLRCVVGHRDFEFSVPEEVQGERRLFTGILCRNSNPVARSSGGLPGFSCKPKKGSSAKVESESFYSSAVVAYEEDQENQNPDGEPAVVQLDGDEWPVYSGNQPPKDTQCDASNNELPQLSHQTEYTLRIAYPRKAREKVNGTFETLRISHRATSGSFQRSASYILPDRKPANDGNLEVETKWTSPAKQDKGHRVIRFVFGIRDGRGGFGMSERYACRPEK